MTAKTHFYDIESLSNAFTNCTFKPEENSIDVHMLIDDEDLYNVPNFEQELLERIYEKNDNFRGTINIYNLKNEKDNNQFAEQFGVSDSNLVNDKTLIGSFPQNLRPVCDTDPEYDETIHPYMFGYNSYNYDTSILAIYFTEVYPFKQLRDENGQPIIGTMGEPEQLRQFEPTTAKIMREYNDELFTDEFRNSMPNRLTVDYDYQTRRWSQRNYANPMWKVRKSMMMSGRHLDVARLNEKQSHVGLKRLLGTLGYQILESDKLATGADSIETTDQLYDLIAYNVSDVVNLKKLFEHPYYQGQFNLKKGLISTYPELVYNSKRDEYTPDIRPEQTRRDRITIDSSSAQFATKALCPYGHLKDIPAVSFMYPSKVEAEKLGIEPFNVLDDTKEFFYNMFPQEEPRQQFDKVYDYYKSIEGVNLNQSDNYKRDYMNTPDYQEPQLLHLIPKNDNCVPYFLPDGSPSSCYVTFSTGGIHGSEYNKELYEFERKEWEQEVKNMEYVKSKFNHPLELRNAKTIEMPDGTIYPYRHFLKSSATIKRMESATPDQYDDFYKDLEKTEPILFRKNKDGSTKLAPKYVYTSADLTNHEDFVSYYPNMLRMMSAFWNPGLGYDRYAEIFYDKERYDVLRYDMNYTEEERHDFDELREGTKLVLNAASGAGDTTWDSSIRVNNLIISMRIIGQLFSWRIGQAQTYEGARIPSTNTDGLYSVLEPELNDLILQREAKSIHVEIEAEPLYLISKDSNNRLEMDPDTGVVTSTSGGSLSCYRDTTPTQSLRHPAITDWALSEYLIVTSTRDNMSLEEPLNMEVGKNILEAAKDKFEKHHLLRMFGNIVSSSIGSMDYIFGTKDNNPETPVILQQYNRVFIMKDNTPGTMKLRSASARKITNAQIAKRKRDNERMQQHDPFALKILSNHGIIPRDIPSEREAVIKKVTKIETDWDMYVQNKSLFHLTDEEIDFIINNLDMEKYLLLLKEAYEDNWMNKTPTPKKKPKVNIQEHNERQMEEEIDLEQLTLFD